MTSSGPDKVMIKASATVGNFGPGFDVLSLSLEGLGDTITIERADRDSIRIDGAGAERIPTEWSANVAGVTIDALRERTGDEDAYAIHIEKGQPGGSGLGSSASSSAGTALAYHHANRAAGLGPVDLVRAAGRGETVAAGEHFDDVAAVVLGGLAIVGSGPGLTLRLDRVQAPERLHLAIARPELDLPTAEMRALLPKSVPLGDAVANLGHVARLVHAMHEGDIAAVGACMDDRLATPYRAVKMPYLDDARSAALEAGAYGLTISGSGPSVLAVCDSPDGATDVARALSGAIGAHGVPVTTLTAQPERGRPYEIPLSRM